MKVVEVIVSTQPVMHKEFDSIITGNTIGSLRERVTLECEDGLRVIPASTSYKRDPEGNRTRVNSPGVRWQKDVMEYALPRETGQNYIEVASEIVFNALPNDASAQIIPSPVAFTNAAEQDTPIGELLRRFSGLFPRVSFGVYGSIAVGLSRKDSDMDLAIVGTRQYAGVIHELNRDDCKDEVNIRGMTGPELQKYASTYASQYGVSVEVARRITENKRRYYAQLVDGSEIKIGLSCIRENEFPDSLLGKKRVRHIAFQGTVVDSSEANCMPRRYKVETDGEQVSVVSNIWTNRGITREGDVVSIIGTLREGNGSTVIGIEHPTDHQIKPIR